MTVAELELAFVVQKMLRLQPMPRAKVYAS